MLTWRLGVSLASALRSEGQRAKLLVLANDWQYLRARGTQNAQSVRAEFYRSHIHLFPEYLSVLEAEGCDEGDVVGIGDWHPYISEYWLRRRIERRLKRMTSGDGTLGLTASSGMGSIVFDDFGRGCRLLHCGQADCAGEVMEMVILLYTMGFRHIVNFVPSECETPVNEGVRRAICVFRLHSLTAVNVSVPSVSLTSQPTESLNLRATRVWGEQDGTGPVEGFTRAFSIPTRVSQE